MGSVGAPRRRPTQFVGSAGARHSTRTSPATEVSTQFNTQGSIKEYEGLGPFKALTLWMSEESG